MPAWMLIITLLIPAILAKPTLDPSIHRQLLLNGRPQIGLWKALLREQEAVEYLSAYSSTQNTFKNKRPSIFEPHCFPQKVSHFDPSNNETFCQRYWVDASLYKPGGPIFLLDGGETSGENRLPFLEKGILEILSNHTEGLSIILEHRYYGESVPVKSFSTDDLRFLNNAEALEDSAHFIENFELPQSLSIDYSLHPNETPWFYYGGSYAGARAAHMRVQYPHLVWGAIASSAVVHAQINFPQYFDPIQQYGPSDCINTLQRAIEFIDNMLDRPGPWPKIFKGFFGLDVLEDEDFADVISSPLNYWQAKNWDLTVGSNEFYNFCDTLTAGGASNKIGIIRAPASVANYARYVRERIVTQCPGRSNADIQECFSTQDDSSFRKTDLSQTWRLWIFQVCTQWGYFMPAPKGGPRIVSKRLTLDYTAKICKQAFPPGNYFSVPPQPDVDEVNRRGDYGIKIDRLAFIDGDRDPWRPMTPQSDTAERRESTIQRPVHIIFDGVHHYDENGLKNHLEEPARIRDVHDFEKLFVSEWLLQWKERNVSGKEV
ncbi:uncharacterized protein L203_103253 [Cryptococcus depauperatus CBS 7841]|uniref:Uncharacterized protein n=1 Tax=Cryptococcus depauperatus CBS 7841 TaxID=1295531 RepID=A0A1E3HPC9_9TREE|nr:serine carboxypeptidase [Cryptococcus depauperatus CBS 7841]